MKTTNEMLNEIINEKQLKERTIINYKQSINQFEEHILMTIPELMEKQ